MSTGNKTNDEEVGSPNEGTAAPQILEPTILAFRFSSIGDDPVLAFTLKGVKTIEEGAELARKYYVGYDPKFHTFYVGVTLRDKPRPVFDPTQIMQLTTIDRAKALLEWIGAIVKSRKLIIVTHIATTDSREDLAIMRFPAESFDVNWFVNFKDNTLPKVISELEQSGETQTGPQPGGAPQRPLQRRPPGR